MLNGLRSDDLVTMLSTVKDDGSGLSLHQAARFLELAKDGDLKPLVDPTVWTEAQRLAPRVREHLRATVPTVG